MTKVWPALWPPWKRTTTSARSDSQSTILPLPSSPHCEPMTATFAITQDSLSKHLNGAVAPEMRAVEAARFLLVFSAGIQRVDGDPAFLPQTQRRIVRGAARQQDAARRLRRRQRGRQGVEIEREAGRVLARLVDIAATAPELAGNAPPEQRERDAGVILEAAVIGRIDVEGKAWRGFAHQL